MLCGAVQSLPAPTDAGSAEIDDSEQALLADVDECRRLDRLRLDYVQHLREAAPERLKVWQSAEARGSAAGLWLMAECYRNGIGVPQDWAAAVDRFSRSALMDFAPAMHKLGILSKRGLGMPKDLELAANWHANAAEIGYIEGMHDLANMYEAGSGVPLDQQKALELWRRAAEAGNELSMYALGDAYRRGDGVEIDIVTAKAWYERAANAGHLYAMERLAMLSLESDPPNDAEAIEWIQRAVASLDPQWAEIIPKTDPARIQWHRLRVQFYDDLSDIVNLAWEYERCHTDSDYREAARWYRVAADQGDADAMDRLGGLYTRGSGVEKNFKKAAELYRRSAEAGESHGMMQWAGSLYYGEGVERDIPAAIDWYEKAMAEGEVRAIMDLAAVYEGSEHFPHDEIKSALLYLQAAKAGHPRAMLAIAKMYCTGTGVPQNLNAAQFWLSRVKPWRFPEIPAIEQMLRDQRREVDRPRRLLAIGFGAFAGLLGVMRLQNIRRRLNAPRQCAVSAIVCFAALLPLLLTSSVGAQTPVPDDEAFAAEMEEYLRRERLGLDGDKYLKEIAPSRLEAWKRGEKRGSPPALCLLALCHDIVPSVTDDQGTSLHHLRRAAAKRYPPGMYLYGLCYHRGVWTEASEDVGIDWIRAAFRRGSIDATHELARAHANGTGVNEDVAIAVTLFRKGAAAGNERSMLALGHCYRQGKGVEQNDATAKTWYKRAANAGQVFAMEWLAHLALADDHVARTEAEALEWIQKAFVALGLSDSIPSSDPVSMQWRKLCVELYDDADDIAWLAEEYEKRGAPGDYAQAVQYYQQAAEQGDTWAMHNVGRMYTNGLGVPVDHTIAAEWYRRSAEAGNAWGMAEWAGSLFYGKGVHQDVYSAIRWYEKSAAENEVRAMLDLAMIYDASDVVAHDYVKAARYYRMAADAGHPRAMLSMAVMCCNGRGVTQDLNAAQFWLSRVKPWRFPETAVVETMIRRRLQTPGQRAMWPLSIGLAAFTGLLGVVRLCDIRRRLEIERRDAESRALV